MERHREPGAASQLHRPQEVLVERVHSAVPDQSHQVQRAALPPHAIAQFDERRQPEEIARGDRLRDAHDVLRDHPARAEVQVPDFAVPHLSLGEAHGEPRGVEQRVRGAVPQPMPGRRVAQFDRIAVPAWTKSPAVEDDQDDRGAIRAGFGHIEGDAS